MTDFTRSDAGYLVHYLRQWIQRLEGKRCKPLTPEERAELSRYLFNAAELIESVDKVVAEFQRPQIQY